MGRTVAVVWHASFSIAAGVLYFFFVLPRWPELLYDTSHTLGTVLRIVAGALIGLAALPVVFTLLRTRRPEFGTPQLASTLRTTSIALHVLAGVLIIGTAISEIWLSLDHAGPWLFGIYGAAAAVALLGIFGFYLAFVAELPPPPPKPLKSKEPKKRRRGRKGAEDAESADTAVDTEATEDAADTADAEQAGPEDAETAEADDEVEDNEDVPAEVTVEDEESPSPEEGETGIQATNGRLRNRRPSGKAEPTKPRRRRLRGGVAVED